MLVLAGSSGRVDTGRAQLLSEHGAVALALRWFGGPGQQPGPYEVPLELFSSAIDVLAEECSRLAVVGLSFGAEAALLIASRDDRIDAVVGFAPSSVVWPGWNGDRWTSHWTAGGVPLPFVPFVPDWQPDAEPPAYVEHYRLSLDADPRAVAEAAIPVEAIRGEVLLVAGTDDQVWPSCEFADRIAERRRSHGLPTAVLRGEGAGHRAILPGEEPAMGGAAMRRGGTEEADRALGAAAWPEIVTILRFAGAR